MGDEYTFQAQAQQNVATLDEAGATRIVTSCPHCFNTIGNEYGDFGGSYEVVHHTELLAELLRDGRLEAPAGRRRSRTTTPATSRGTTTSSPRRGDRLADRQAARDGAQRKADVLLRRRRGAHVDGGARRAINEERVREAAETGAETLAVACPFCTMMLDDGVKQAGAGMRVADVSVLLAEALGPRD